MVVALREQNAAEHVSTGYWILDPVLRSTKHDTSGAIIDLHACMETSLETHWMDESQPKRTHAQERNTADTAVATRLADPCEKNV